MSRKSVLQPGLEITLRLHSHGSTFNFAVIEPSRLAATSLEWLILSRTQKEVTATTSNPALIFTMDSAAGVAKPYWATQLDYITSTVNQFRRHLFSHSLPPDCSAVLSTLPVLANQLTIKTNPLACQRPIREEWRILRRG
jgi:hypothetical protein